MGGLADPMVEAEGVRPDEVPDPRRPLNINDNYCVLDPVPVAHSMNVVESVKDKDISVFAPVNVSCPFVSPVLSAINISRLSQKNDVRKSSIRKKERNKENL